MKKTPVIMTTNSHVRQPSVNRCGTQSRKRSTMSAICQSLSASDCSDSDSNDGFLDFNEDDCERELEHCKKQLQEITSNFEFLKETLLQEKLNEIDKKIDAINSGNDKEFNDLFKQLYDEEASELQVAAVLKDFKFKSLDMTYKALEQAIGNNYKNAREIVYDTIQSRLEKEIQDLTDERNKADLDVKLFHAQQLRKNVKLKPKKVSGPCIVYMLKDDEILEDCITINNLLNPPKTENAKQEE